MTDLGTRQPLSRGLARPQAPDDPDPELSLREVVRVLRANVRMIAILAIGAPMLAAIIVLLTPRTWTSTASFYPENRRSAGGLNSLAQQYGISLPGMGNDPGQSLQFYIELLRSREILSRVLTDTLAYASTGTSRRPLLDLLDLPDGTPAERLDEGVIKLRGMIRTAPNLTTGIVKVAVTTKSPTLSQAVSQRLLDLVNDFNLQKRQSQGASERRFAERRLAEMADSLRAAELRVQEFEQRNVQYQTSPTLRMQHQRLMNNLAAKQTLHTALAQSYEQARIEEVRDTPVITLLEQPVVPVRPDSRRGLQKMTFAFVIAVMLGIVYAFMRAQSGFFRTLRA